VILKKVGAVKHTALDDNPHVVLLVVLGNILHGELLFGNGELLLVSLLVLAGVGALGIVLEDGMGGVLTGNLGDRTLAGAVPVDRNAAGSVGVDVEGDLIETGGGTSPAAFGEELLEEVLAGRFTGDTPVDDTTQEGRAAETVGTVNTTSNLTAGKETLERLALLVQDLGMVVDLDSTHGEVEDRLHKRNVEVIIDLEGEVVEEAFAVRILLLALSDGVVFLEHFLKVSGAAADFFGQLLAGHLPHETTARVMAGVEIKNLGRFAVEHQADGKFVLEHFARDIVAVTKLIAESVTFSVQQ
jgi:hypothetical protein